MSRDRCKVEDAVDNYNLHAPTEDAESIHEYLIARWTGNQGYQSVGYRKLTDWFNKQLIRQTYDEHGRSTIGTRVESDYEALTQGTGLVREEIIDDLNASGIDAESLLNDMISPRTMHRHLTGCLNVQKETPEAKSDWERESIEIARAQLEEKVSKAVSSLASKNEYRGAEEADIDIRIYLSCPECTTRVPFESGLHRGYVCEDHHSPPREASIAINSPGDEPARSNRQTGPVVEAVAQFSR